MKGHFKMPINKKIPRANDVRIALVSNLDDWDGITGPIDKDLRQVVVQKTSIDRIYTYALQHVAGDTFIYRGLNGKNVAFNKNFPVLVLTGSAAGHTQTFEYANKHDQWFVGTKPNDLNPSPTWSTWSKQIARVSIPHSGIVKSNTELQPRLSNLNHAGANFNIGCLGNEFARVEAAVSPDREYFLIAYGDNMHNGYFALYYLHDINKALDHAATSSRYVDIAQVNCLRAFKIPNLSGENGQVGSLQGFGIDHYLDQFACDRFDLYISSQPSSDMIGADRKIIKLAWGETDASKWEMVDLTKDASLEIPGYYTEIEGLQVISKNDVYLTVAYHQSVDPKDSTRHPTKINKVYRVIWDAAEYTSPL